MPRGTEARHRGIPEEVTSMAINPSTWERLRDLSGKDPAVPVEGTSYRIREDWLRFLPVLSRIDDLGSGIVAIDGPSASGKTTLGHLLGSVYGCPVIRMDDFFLPRERATPARLKEIGGNLDHERFLEEVVLPLKAGKEAVYHVFDCTKQAFSQTRKVPPSPLVIVEGVYSLHPRFADLYSLRVFLDVAAGEKIRRIFCRNGKNIGLSFRHLRKWLPLEDRYFRALNLAEQADLRIR